MQSVYAIGESLVDFIYQDSKVVAKKPGGSMLNTSVSLGRLKQNIAFISELGNDVNGDFVTAFLKENFIDLQYLYRFKMGKTAMAKAVLDENNNANYTFRKNYPQKRLMIKFPRFEPDDYLLFGSIYALENQIWPVLNKILKSTRSAESLIFYDPNIRKTHLKEEGKGKVRRNMSIADIIRCSDEDMKNIFGARSFAEACTHVPEIHSKVFIYTQAQNSVCLKAGDFWGEFKVPGIEVVSTIGAGDNFNAGLIYGLLFNHVNKSNLFSVSDEKWSPIIKLSIRFAGNVCQTYDNYISEDFAAKIIAETDL